MGGKKDYTADAKKKAISNIIDEKAINLTKQILPNYWTIRDYKPDYGIDLAIETFDDNTLETGIVTLRDRDTMEQVNLSVSEVIEYVNKKLKF